MLEAGDFAISSWRYGGAVGKLANPYWCKGSFLMSKKKADDGGTIPSDIQKMEFEEAFKSLEEIVNQLEDGRIGLEDSINIYARGMQLKGHCAGKLSSAREQVEKIVTMTDGALSTEAADID
jgi:exodeoxyribonuclease VII small subunit